MHVQSSLVITLHCYMMTKLKCGHETKKNCVKRLQAQLLSKLKA